MTALRKSDSERRPCAYSSTLARAIFSHLMRNPEHRLSANLFRPCVVAGVALAIAGCRPDYAKLEACSPAELVEIMRGGWRVNRDAAGAELSTLAMRKPDLVRPVAGEIHELLRSPYPETRRWAICVLLRLDLFRGDLAQAVRSELAGDRHDGVATVLYHLVQNPIVLHESHDLVVRALSDDDHVVIHAAVDCIAKESESTPLDDDAAVDRLLELCRTNNIGWQSKALQALSRVTPRLRAGVSQSLATVNCLPHNEKAYATAVEATSRREGEG